MMQQQMAARAPQKPKSNTMDLVFKASLGIAVGVACWYAYQKYYKKKPVKSAKSESESKSESSKKEPEKPQKEPESPPDTELSDKLRQRESEIDALRRTVDNTEEQLGRLSTERQQMLNHIQVQDDKIGFLQTQLDRQAQMISDTVPEETPSEDPPLDVGRAPPLDVEIGETSEPAKPPPKRRTTRKKATVTDITEEVTANE